MNTKNTFGSGERIRGRKERGEWAELCFMARAAGEGFRILKPYGDSGRFDVAVNDGARFLRVQVKSTTFRRGNRYSVNMLGAAKKKYPPGTVDFFAVLLIPIAEWYIFPYKTMRNRSVLQFTPGSKRTNWILYREAWYLLRRESGLTIQACVEPVVAEEEVIASDFAT